MPRHLFASVVLAAALCVCVGCGFAEHAKDTAEADRTARDVTAAEDERAEIIATLIARHRETIEYFRRAIAERDARIRELEAMHGH